MKNFKQVAFGLLVGALAIGLSSFTTVKRANSNFYLYTSASTAQTDIQNINNYEADTNPCGGTTTNVCGVVLSTSKPDGQEPVASEFSAEEGNLWTSQQNHSPANSSIKMKP